MTQLHHTVSRRQRGIALLATVSISVIASVAAMVVITLTLDSTRAESTTLNRMEAIEEAEAARAAFEEELLVAPLFFYNSVFAHERARVCTQGDGRVVEPGNVWPAACGTLWDYQQASSPGGVRMELIPPSIEDPQLVVRILSDIGGYEAGIEATYALDSTARYSLYSQDNLDLSVLPHTTASQLHGETYSGGTVTLPQWGLVSNHGIFAAEGGFPRAPEDSPLGASDVRFYAGSADLAADVAVYDVRDLYPVAVPLTGLRGSFASLVELACQSGLSLVDSVATRFCLHAGGQLVDASGSLVDIPADVESYLILPGAGVSGGVTVYWSNKQSTAPSSCGSGCDLAADSATAIAAGTHPGDASFWTLLGTFPGPGNGVIHADRDTHIGSCGGAFVTSSGSCTEWDTGGGVEVDMNMTIAAGSLVDPADVWISGPVRVAEDVSFGAVASGRVRLPYWARPTGSNGIVHGVYTALGVGAGGTAVETYPTTITGSSNTAPALMVDGGFIGTGIDTSFPLYQSVSISNQVRNWTAPPPLYPSATGAWRIVLQRRLAPVEVCGATQCTAF